MEKSASRHFFLVGIGGIGMQALADVLVGMGHRVTGSNNTDFPDRSRLEQKGIKVFVGEHKSEQVPNDIAALIYTSAIKADFPKGDHPEVVRARELGVPVYKRSEFIGELMRDFIGITVSGTHGKTTTSTLITLILQQAGLMPSALIGAEVKSLRGCGIVGSGKYMVVEACEYDRSFLDMHPQIAVLTNIEADHLDYYQDIDEIREAFAQFVEQVPDTGLIVACGDDDNVRAVLPRAQTKVVTFGFKPNNDLIATDVRYEDGRMRFQVQGKEFALNFPGRHLVLDALAAIAVARHLNIDDEAIDRALSEFKGARRRFEIVADKNGATFVDDYGHHPTEIKAALTSARDYFDGRPIRVVFQAHQYSRTRLLLEGFAESFKLANEVLVAPILPVRDTAADIAAIDHHRLVDEINKVSHNAKAVKDFDEVSQYLNSSLKPGDVVISLGAGKNSEWIIRFAAQNS
ncbi:MAG: UDP-N-acetylmuramate--L-alanine ligase [Patescibacteria group bacterium]|jgi:UDP-N-acetylmuramate--alanine ligase